MGNLFSSLSSNSQQSSISNSTAQISKELLSNRACLGAGCYWGTEKFFKSKFPAKILNGKVGFMGPKTAAINPSYKDVCSGVTGHVEVYDFEFSEGIETYEELIRYFFQFHDPTTLNRQGNDKGTQYASVIYAYDKNQFEIAKKVKDELQTLINNKQVTCFEYPIVSTDIRMSTTFYPANDEHQEYLEKNPRGYCNHRVRLKDWPDFPK